jgi:hypothetical protein
MEPKDDPRTMPTRSDSMGPAIHGIRPGNRRSHTSDARPTGQQTLPDPAVSDPV